MDKQNEIKSWNDIVATIEIPKAIEVTQELMDLTLEKTKQTLTDLLNINREV